MALAPERKEREENKGDKKEAGTVGGSVREIVGAGIGDYAKAGLIVAFLSRSIV